MSFSDEACTQKVGTLITNEDGRAGYYLDPGTYWAKETGDEYGRFEDEYWMVDEPVQKFEIKPMKENCPLPILPSRFASPTPAPSPCPTPEPAPGRFSEFSEFSA